MNNAQSILTLIKDVVLTDTATLDEIDARVFYLLYEKPYDDALMQVSKKHRNVPEYTRSRDALKAIRPQGFIWVVTSNKSGIGACTVVGKVNEKRFVLWGEDNEQKSEELAELYAIIKAIEFERSQK